MAEQRDWERTLKETSYDLPEETWQRLENDMRGWLANEARSPRRARPWYEPLLGVFQSWRVGLAGAVAACVLAFGAWFWIAPDRLSWAPGQALDAHGTTHWNWIAERCEIDGQNARLVLSSRGENEVGIKLERGEATFHVQHRRPDESFTVDVGDCKVHVVGTIFTVGVDSLQPWVAVQEGRIRLEHRTFQRFVSAGQKSTCREDVPAAVPPAPAATESRPSPSVAVAVAAGVSVAAAADSIVVPSCQEGAACVRILSEFVRIHPAHPATPGVALRWARLAARGGDTRDALVAYGIASSSAALVDEARLESLRMRSEQLSQEKTVADSLEVWIPSLRPGSAIWNQAWILRGDVARRLGDAESAERAGKALNAPATAEGGK
jgi:hypothetical protein